MSKYLGVIFALLIFFTGSICRAESNAGLLKKMQRQLDAMQKRLTDLEAKNAALEARLAEVNMRPAPPDKNQSAGGKAIRQAKKNMPYVLGNLSLTGNITGIIQGTLGNDDNRPDEGDVSDGSWSSELWIKSAAGKHGKAAMLVEAGEGKGVTDEVKTFFGVNDDARGDNTRLEVTNAFYEHLFLDDRLLVSVGKMDIKDYFDTNSVAHDRHTQFLSSGFHHSIGVAWPNGNGLTVRSKYSPNDLVDFALCWTEGEADWEDIFEDSFFIGEIGFNPMIKGELAGNYRLYGWMNGSDMPSLENTGADENGGYGFGLSANQKIHPLMTAFARFSWEDEDVYAVAYAWSTGIEIGMTPMGRPRDVLALAYGQALTSDALDLEDEGHVEIYYRLKLFKHLSVSPHFQYFWNPLGDGGADDIAVLGVRSVVSF